jgi:hypothetical protein
MSRPPKKELKDDALDIRRDRVLELTSQGYSQRQIATILNLLEQQFSISSNAAYILSDDYYTSACISLSLKGQYLSSIIKSSVYVILELWVHCCIHCACTAT